MKKNCGNSKSSSNNTICYYRNQDEIYAPEEEKNQHITQFVSQYSIFFCVRSLFVTAFGLPKLW